MNSAVCAVIKNRCHRQNSSVPSLGQDREKPAQRQRRHTDTQQRKREREGQTDRQRKERQKERQSDRETEGGAAAHDDPHPGCWHTEAETDSETEADNETES